MKRIPKKYICFLSGMLLLLSTGSPVWGADRYVYEKRDEVAEKKRYAIRMEQDKQKVELAVINTKTLISKSKNKPYLPELYMRLAELYVEKSRLVYFLRKSSASEAAEEGALDQYEANMLKQQALEIYQRILSNHPDFEQNDKVHFFMAHEYRELGQIDEMIKQYQTVIAKFPDSSFAPESHLLLGDYYFSQKQDVDKSTAAYEAVLKYPHSPAVAAARYKLAWCRINLVDFSGALKLFEESVASPLAQKDLNIDTYRRVDVRLESLIDMAFCYPEVHKKATARQALDYFRRYSWSRPVYATVLEKLAYRFYVKKNWPLSAALYRELAVLRQDPEKLIEYAKHIFESEQALGKYENAEEDVAIIIRALEKQRYSAHVPDDEKAKMAKDYELYARDIITHLHDKARRSNSRKDFEIAADAYKLYLDFFEESPAVDEMAGNYAEVLFSSGQYLEAGKQYEKIAPAATVNTRQRGEKLYSAVISYYQALKEKDQLNYYQTAYAREGLRAAGRIYATEFASSSHTPDVLFNVAWVSYDAGQYEDAIKDFANFVTAYPRSKAAKAAVHLTLDAYNLLEDYDGLIHYGKTVMRSSIGDAALRREVAQIVSSAESKVVSTMTVAAMDNYENAREELIQVASQKGSGAMGEQALNALVLSSKDKHDLPTLFESCEMLISKYPDSENAKQSLVILIDTALKIGNYRLLANYLELYAQRYPKDAKASLFRFQAGQIQEGLGKYSEANANYRRILGQGKVNRVQLGALVFSYADNAEQLGNVDSAIQVLQSNIGRLSSEARILAKARLGILNLRADRRTKAFKLYREVKKGYRPAMGQNDPDLLDHVAELAYSEIYHSSGPYFSLRLKNKIDNAVVGRKAQMLQKLEEGYQEVMAFKSPAWALKACYRANEINREFADFLIKSPAPAELGPQERQQYRELIQQKAQAYVDKADQYLHTCIQMAHKWEICDPGLAGFFLPEGHPSGREDGFASLTGGRQACAEIAAQGLADALLNPIYRQLLSAPEDIENQVALAKAYMKQGDFRQAALIAKNALDKKSNDGNGKAELLNILGVSYLYSGNDPLAKEIFSQAMAADQGASMARINLAGLYKHYGHQDKAAEMMKTATPSDLKNEGVHPRIGAIYNAYLMQGK